MLIRDEYISCMQIRNREIATAWAAYVSAQDEEIGEAWESFEDVCFRNNVPAELEAAEFLTA